MSDKSEIVVDESMRLDRLGIPYLFINSYEGMAVTVLDSRTMKSIVHKRETGTMISGRFVSMMEPGRWAASFVDADGIHHHRDMLTESKAYRMVLGYPIGRKNYHTRYAGQCPVRKQRKIRSMSVRNHSKQL